MSKIKKIKPVFLSKNDLKLFKSSQITNTSGTKFIYDDKNKNNELISVLINDPKQFINAINLISVQSTGTYLYFCFGPDFLDISSKTESLNNKPMELRFYLNEFEKYDYADGLFSEKKNALKFMISKDELKTSLSLFTITTKHKLVINLADGILGDDNDDKKIQFQLIHPHSPNTSFNKNIIICDILIEYSNFDAATDSIYETSNVIIAMTKQSLSLFSMAKQMSSSNTEVDIIITKKPKKKSLKIVFRTNMDKQIETYGYVNNIGYEDKDGNGCVFVKHDYDDKISILKVSIEKIAITKKILTLIDSYWMCVQSRKEIVDNKEIHIIINVYKFKYGRFISFSNT